MPRPTDMTYRSQQDVLWARKTELEQEQARIERSQTTLKDVERELKDVRAQLRALGTSSASPLDRMKVAAPCSQKWENMVGDERSRHCASCDKSVYNISAMTRVEAETFLASQTEAPCVRYYQRADGTVMTTDCPVGVKRRRLKVISAVAACAGITGAGLVNLFAAQTTMGGLEPIPRGKVESSSSPEVALPGPAEIATTTVEIRTVPRKTVDLAAHPLPSPRGDKTKDR